jgi:hypothetical protein
MQEEYIKRTEANGQTEFSATGEPRGQLFVVQTRKLDHLLPSFVSTHKLDMRTRYPGFRRKEAA